MFQHKLSLTKTYATSLAFLKFVCNMFNKFREFIKDNSVNMYMIENLLKITV
jgi:hypothetical protein